MFCYSADKLESGINILGQGREMEIVRENSNLKMMAILMYIIM